MKDPYAPAPQDFDVGYGRPPKTGQFPSGRSGNPRGRPKGKRGVGAVLHDLMTAKITVTERGKSRRVSRLEVMLLQLANDATRGDQRAVKLLLELTDRYRQEAEVSVASDELTPEDLELLTDYLGKTEPARGGLAELTIKEGGDDGESV
jgi:hypothetical protein